MNPFTGFLVHFGILVFFRYLFPIPMSLRCIDSCSIQFACRPLLLLVGVFLLLFGVLGGDGSDVVLSPIGEHTTPEDSTYSIDLSATKTGHMIVASGGIGGTISNAGTTFVENDGSMTYIISPHFCSTDGSILGGHVDVDTSNFIAEVNGASHWAGIGGHVHEYDVEFGITGVDFMDIEGNSLKNINEYIVDGDQKFKLILGNTALSPGVRLVINKTYDQNDPSTFSLPSDYDDTAVADLPIYSLTGNGGAIQLTDLSFQFHVSAIANRHVHPSQAINVMRNDLGPNGEWRNGALVLQAVAVNADGSDAFTLDTAKSNGGHGVAASGLLYEALVYWHWSGPSYDDYAAWLDYDPGEITYTDTADCTNYVIEDVLVDGVSVGAVGTYTFENVTENHTIEAIFSRADGDPITGDPPEVVDSTFTYSAVVNSGNVTATVDGDTLDLVPDENWFGTASITVTVVDENGDTDEETFDFVVTPVNDLPVLSSVGDQTTPEDSAKVVTLSATDIENDESALTYTATSSDHITATVVGNLVTFTPEPNWFGTESITIEVEDSDGAVDTETIDVVITPVNDLPILTAVGGQTTSEDTPKVITLSGTDIEDDDTTLTYTATSSTNITATLVGNMLTLTPAPNWSGTESITIEVEDSEGGVDTEMIEVTVSPVNDPPVLTGIGDKTTAEDTLKVINLSETDLEDDNETLIYSVTGSANITGTIVDDVLTLTPAPNWNGTESITVTVTDSEGGVDTETIEVTVSPVNDPPVLFDPVDTTTPEDTATVITLSGTDLEDDDTTLTYAVIDSEHITATLVNNMLTLTPDENWSGTETITVEVEDREGETDTQTFEVTVTPVNDPPVFEDPGQPVFMEDHTVSVTLISTDVEDEDSSLVYTTEVLTGQVSVIITGDEIELIPDENWFGEGSIEITVTDEEGGIDTRIMEFTVTPVNDPPVLDRVPTQIVEQNHTLIVDLHAEDVDFDSLTFSSTEPTGNLTVITNGDELLITPKPGWTGTSEITVFVEDGNGGIVTNTFPIGVVPHENDPPVLELFPVQISEQNSTTEINLEAIDPNGDPLTYSVELISGEVTPTIEDGVLTLIPENNWAGIAEFEVTVEDGRGGIDIKTFELAVNDGTNDPPILTETGNLVAQEDEILNLPVTAIDPNGDPLLYEITVLSGEIDVSKEGDEFVIQPLTNWSGEAELLVTVKDGNGGIDYEIIELTVNSENDPPVLAPVPTQNVELGEILEIDLNAIDPDLDNLTYTAMVDDGNGNTHSQTFYVGFNEPDNDPPILEEISTQVSQENTSLQLPLLATDPNGDPLTYEVTVKSGNVTPTLTGTNLTLEPETGWSGIATIEVKVTDEKGGVSTQTFDVAINEDGRNSPRFPIRS